MQRRATKHIILNLGFITDISYKTRLLQLDILPVSYWHEYLDLVFLYKIINNLTYIDERALPIMAGSGITRSESNANLVRFVIPYAKTVTFQTSFFIRTCKTCNILNSNLRTRDIGFLSFKSGLKLYYKHALSTAGKFVVAVQRNCWRTRYFTKIRKFEKNNTSEISTYDFAFLRRRSRKLNCMENFTNISSMESIYIINILIVD